MLTFVRPKAWKNPHEPHDWINLQLARMAAAHLREHPESVAAARARLVRWMAQGTLLPGMTNTAKEWLSLLDTMTPADLADLLESETENATRLRSSSPCIRGPFFTREESLPILEAAFAPDS